MTRQRRLVLPLVLLVSACVDLTSAAHELNWYPANVHFDFIGLEPASMTLNVGVVDQFQVHVTYKEGVTPVPEPTIKWTSSNPSIATVLSGGVVTAVAPGVATITADNGRVSNYANVQVRAVHDFNANGLPQFIVADFVDLSKIESVSRFRSNYGIDYNDGFEHCRSMIHYFRPFSGVAWTSLQIMSPVSGTIERVIANGIGGEVHIRPDALPAAIVILQNIKDSPTLSQPRIKAGEQLGAYAQNGKPPSIAININTPSGQRLVSYFDAMSDELFQQYVARGIASRSAMVISKSERDAQPLNCSTSTLPGSDVLPAWVNLTK
jgi:hypothetical protein